jgi:putative phosphoribosyl transferase
MLLDKIRSKFQFRLKDRSTAGSILATALMDNLKSREERQQSIVLGIPRGGVIVADIIAKKLSCDNNSTQASGSTQLRSGNRCNNGRWYYLS